MSREKKTKMELQKCIDFVFVCLAFRSTEYFIFHVKKKAVKNNKFKFNVFSYQKGASAWMKNGTTAGV